MKIKSGDCSYELAANSLINEKPFEYDEAIKIGEACYSKDNNNLNNLLGQSFLPKMILTMLLNIIIQLVKEVCFCHVNS